MASTTKQSKIDLSPGMKGTSQMTPPSDGSPNRTDVSPSPQTTCLGELKKIEKTIVTSQLLPPLLKKLSKIKSADKIVLPIVKFQSLMSAKIETSSGFVKGNQSIKKGSIFRKVKLDDLLVVRSILSNSVDIIAVWRTGPVPSTHTQ
uniref:Uncharacterized protein n=1 Tax=Romanomermis culicivorax TaxID=13658 RepID=A0A915L2A0_ROMCU